MTLGRDAIISLRVDPAPTVEAELVFAGYGLSVPEVNHDDFAGLDVRGKLVVHLAGAPSSIPGPLAAHMQSAAERAAVLKRHGAIGVVNILNPKNMDIPWERLALARFHAVDESWPIQRWMTAGASSSPSLSTRSTPTSFLPARAIPSERSSRRPTPSKPLPRFALPAKLAATASVKRADVVSQNVVAMLPGTDPRLKNEYVVFSAHLDHLGIGKPIKGDAIYNGAMDNASGVAAMLDVAAMLKETGTKSAPVGAVRRGDRRGKGLLGSRYLRRQPDRYARAIVANINTDMFLPLFPLKKLTIYGLDESDLGDDAAAVAEIAGRLPQADPEPKRNIFIRSDQYSFIRRGIPSLALKVGFDKGSPRGVRPPRNG